MLGRKAPGDSVKRAEVTREENTPRVDQPSRAEQNRREADRAVGLRRSDPKRGPRPGRFDQYTPLTHSRSHIFSVNKADHKWQRPPRMVNRNRDTQQVDKIEDLVRRGYLNQFKKRDDPPKRRNEDRADRPDRRGHRGPAGDKDIDGKLEGRVYVISGGPVHGVTVNRARADLRAMIHQINDNDKRRWPPLPSQPQATFDEYDQKGIIYPHDDPLVVTMRIANWEVDRILIDRGSSANIIYISAFNELKLDRKDQKRVSYEVTRFNGSGLTPEGIIELLVRVGERSRRRDVRAEFLVINSPSPYNVIMGRPLIHKIGGVVSTYHLAMAYTTNEGWSAKLRGSQKTTQQCYITALKQPVKTRQQPGS
ncbi:uncharacterized protein LOC110709897 [Chenopodium quinoa]|uniref:uncharacterized protein LOC110709897 n=1 Tax=Chenopodium quinoa TaxID=63459 RepID=UPI000B79097F|nr:uncharacterized protein LOC110709897 [Chenopodium quinoa]